MTYRKLFFLAFLCPLVACSAKPNLYLLESAPAGKQLSTVATLIEVSQIDLPQYVQASELLLRSENGVVRTQKNDLWADAPGRALTEILARALDETLSADVAAEPWPFDVPADLRVTVKVHQMIGTAGQELRFSGQYFLGASSASDLAIANRFDFSVPLKDTSLQVLSSAHTQAISRLADQIATNISKLRTAQLF